MTEKATVLIADDSHSVRVYLRQRLQEGGFEVIVAEDGAIAIEKLDESMPDLAILDIHMPEVDGYGVCESIRERGSKIPIIFLTSNQSNAVQMLGEEMGAYLKKPVTGERLMQTVRDLLAADKLTRVP